MRYKKIYPSSKIGHIVQFFWEFEGDFNDAAPYNHSITASINPKLAFQYKGGMSLVKNKVKSNLFRSGFQCQTNSFSNLVADQKIGVFGAYFQPYAIPLLFNIPAEVLTNQNIEIAELLGKEGEELEEKMMLCDTLTQRIAIMTHFIEEKLKNNSQGSIKLLSAIHHIVSTRGIINVADIVGNYFLSQRQFERSFKQLTGFSPKMFSRIVRFEECVSKAVLSDGSLTDITFTSGYYDQSHMIRDFREFSGKSPGNYFSEDLSMFFR